jgi:hypothetical protein
MYKEYLGKGYHQKVRSMLTVDEELLPNRIIDAEANIDSMKMLISPILEKMNMFGKKIDNEQKFSKLSDAALYYLCGILCVALKSRTSSPPFNVPKYKKRWDKKREGYIQKGNNLMIGLMNMG